MIGSMNSLAKEIINGRRLKRGEDFSFFKTCDLDDLCSAADLIRKTLLGDRVELCSIINGLSGRCGENCKFCAQSTCYKSSCDSYGFLDGDVIFTAAQNNERQGVHRFSIVTSGRGLKGKDFEKALAVYRRMNKELNIKLCASMGFLTREQFRALKKAGVTRYHNNIETSRRNFPSVCTSHTYDMKIEAIKTAHEEGLTVCSGGIIGMGETFDDRIDMAVSLSELKVFSIPINVLMPIRGTPFANLRILSEDEILRTLAMFKMINPESIIRLGAGRRVLANAGERAFKSGISATITGDMLTTSGMTIQGDRAMLTSLGRAV